MINKIISEPLFHFLIIGALLFTLFGESNISNPNKKIEIQLTQKEIQDLKDNYQNTYKQKINKTVEKSLINQAYNNQILLYEALLINLDKETDKKKTIKKMQFIISNTIAVKEPTEEALFSYYKENIQAYSSKKAFSFVHIYFKNLALKNHNDMHKLINILDIKKEDFLYFGDKYKNKKLQNISKNEMIEVFGKYFTLQVSNLQKNRWSMPILSKYGQHYVYINDYKVSKPYLFEEVQERVYNDYIFQKSTQNTKEVFEKIKSKYRLKNAY